MFRSGFNPIRQTVDNVNPISIEKNTAATIFIKRNRKIQVLELLKEYPNVTDEELMELLQREER